MALTRYYTVSMCFSCLEPPLEGWSLGLLQRSRIVPQESPGPSHSFTVSLLRSHSTELSSFSASSYAAQRDAHPYPRHVPAGGRPGPEGLAWPSSVEHCTRAGVRAVWGVVTHDVSSLVSLAAAATARRTSRSYGARSETEVRGMMTALYWPSHHAGVRAL